MPPSLKTTYPYRRSKITVDDIKNYFLRYRKEKRKWQLCKLDHSNNITHVRYFPLYVPAFIALRTATAMLADGMEYYPRGQIPQGRIYKPKKIVKQTSSPIPKGDMLSMAIANIEHIDKHHPKSKRRKDK